ncbi:MAG: choice-of-anchor A family protein [Hyalangium sp.]|uniref:choice-of-anchor A family protein n=1 Tax=Hyalangium sp. TaxID=2028555 RepID=UPI003899A0DF
MSLNTIRRAFLLLAALAGAACNEEPTAAMSALSPSTLPQEVRSEDKVLILGSSVANGLNSREAQAVAADSPATRIDVVTPDQWRALTAQQFMAYRAIIIGDAACQSGTDAFQAAIDNRKNWGAIVDGDVAILATDPSSNGTDQLVENGIRYVLNSVQRHTGMYIALGCAYQNAPAGTSVTLLEPFGDFTVQGVPGCADSAHIFEMYNDFMSRDIFDGMLSGAGGCAARSVFTHYPDRAFSYAGVAMQSSGTLPGQQHYSDFMIDPGNETPIDGTPYILVRGAMTLAAGCGLPEEAPSGEECDLGDNLNGQPALAGQPASETCSWSCHRNWCGDGVVDKEFGEECDNGDANGRTGDTSGSISNCTSFCKLPQLTAPAGQPPTALCHNVTQVAEYTCGVNASIDSGSYDADNDLVGCTQSPAGPYAIGDTTVTLTCTDKASHSSSCRAVVTVVDHVAPTVALNGPDSQTLECTQGGTYSDPGATASDLCSGPLPASAIAKTGSVNVAVPSTYSLSYSATDSAGNLSATVSRTVTVADTLAPALALKGSANMSLECGTPYAEPGATASDLCAGTLPVTVTGAVNPQVPASYTLHYSANDGSGHGVSADRTVAVVDTLAPRIQPIGGAVTLQCNGAPYVDAGATATDICSNDLTSRITASSNLDQTHAGQYTVTYSVKDNAGNTGTAVRQLTVAGPCANSCIDVHLSDYNLFLQDSYTGGHDVVGKVAAGGNISMTDFSVGQGLPDSDVSKTLVAGGNLSLYRGGVGGEAFYGGTLSTDQTVTFTRGSVSKGTPIDFTARFSELRTLSSRLASLTANGTTKREVWGGVMLTGTNPNVNVFDVSASAFTGAVLLSIDAPAGSFVVLNIRGTAATFQGFGHSFSGGIDQHGILYNFVDATSITANGYGFWGTVLAPYANVNFSNGSFDGGIYAKSMTGNAEGHINPLNDRTLCP